jgi:hypothetical protein
MTHLHRNELRIGTVRPVYGFARWAAVSALLAGALVLSGCAVPARVPDGTTVQTTLAELGPPTADIALPDGGRRLQYSQMPAGSQVWNLDFDASGRLRSSDQALRYGNFDRIVLGKTTAADIQREYGLPLKIEYVYSFNGPIWSYRFNDMNNFRRIFIHIDPAGVVQRVLYVDEQNIGGPLDFNK